MTTTPTTRKPLPRKSPAKRLFSGMAGSPLARVEETQAPEIVPLPVPKKRGRKPKHATEEDRKAADAARKRENRKEDRQEKQSEQLADRRGTDSRGALPGETSGGNDANKIDLIVARQDTTRLSSPNADAPTELKTPDRKVTAVPKNPDNNTKDTRETDNTFMRRAGAELRRWARGTIKKSKSCVSDHAVFAEKHKDSKRKLYCGKCQKLLVNPGKPVKQISVRDPAGNIVPISSGNFPDALPGAKKTTANVSQSTDRKEDTSKAA